MKKIKTIIISGLLTPIISFAQTAQTGGTLSGTNILLTNAGRIVTRIIIPIVFTLALLFFFWGVAKYIRSAGSEKDEGKKIMVWGVVALFVMASVWGLVAFLQTELLGSGGNTSVPIPSIGGDGQDWSQVWYNSTGENQ